MANETPHPEEPELPPKANEPPSSKQTSADNSKDKPPEPATPTVPEVPSLPTSPPQPFQFEGSAGEYFGIWLVNLLLSVITLGIYSAWAKVRRLRFFLGYTTIGGHRFEYHANPMAILKGRLVAVGVLIILNVISWLAPILGGLTTLALLLLQPLKQYLVQPQRDLGILSGVGACLLQGHLVKRQLALALARDLLVGDCLVAKVLKCQRVHVMT